jgi:hypothetical protein
VADIGSLEGTPILTYFNKNQRMIGFYGTVGANFITSIGFVMHDPECVAIAGYTEPVEISEEALEEEL